MSIWFTADTHFSHANIIRYCNRNFCLSIDEQEDMEKTLSSDTIEQHDEHLIEQWNKVVNKGDRVYHLGDFTWGPIRSISPLVERLNGDKFLILGNHDKFIQAKLKKGDLSGFLWIKDVYNLNIKGKGQFFLFHYACRTWSGSFKGSNHLYGHSHGQLPEDGTKSMDVGVDSAALLLGEYRPFHIDEVLNHLQNKNANTL